MYLGTYILKLKNFCASFISSLKLISLKAWNKTPSRIFVVVILAAFAVFAYMSYGLLKDSIRSVYIENNKTPTNLGALNIDNKANAEHVPKNVVIVIDPGHGGDETGTSYGSTVEKNINLDISLRTGKLIESEGINVLYTRKNDVYVGLKERAEFANKNDAVLFLSVHNNMMPGDPDYRGTETLYCTPRNPSPGVMDGEKFATIVQRELVTSLKTRDNGTIYRPNLAVTRRTDMPAVIAEVAYISNKSDRSRLQDSDFRQDAASALKRAVIKTLTSMGAKKQADGKWYI